MQNNVGTTEGQVCNALSFYRFQNVLGWSKSFVLDQTYIYVLWQSQTFCAGQKDDLHSVKLVFEEAVKFLCWLKKFGPAQNILGPVKGEGIRVSLQLRNCGCPYVNCAIVCIYLAAMGH